MTAISAKLTWNPNTEEAKVVFSPAFESQHFTVQLDCLQDWLAEIKAKYDSIAGPVPIQVLDFLQLPVPNDTRTSKQKKESFDKAVRDYQAAIMKIRKETAPLAKKAFAEQEAARAAAAKAKSPRPLRKKAASKARPPG